MTQGRANLLLLVAGAIWGLRRACQIRKGLVFGLNQKPGSERHPIFGRVSGRPGPMATILTPLARCSGMSCTIVEVTPESLRLKFGAITSTLLTGSGTISGELEPDDFIRTGAARCIDLDRVAFALADQGTGDG